ncbi:glutamate--cysteine ligase [Yinghuangia sp. ASG 101]|uniref:carboxylate-amine ligase n=1 Tax=Yinghuangia sp. ASG 101 TaxID=2896848 RepID=UPI001E37BA46|nr:glutamate--cysteine ligase [Yinghuangia sp. ASG 101]UGQ10804.1 glutamate--cysteine ligase [Yinghuangia sp. ASG 101]
MTTVGVEEEFHLVDRHTRQLTPGAASVLELLPPQGFTAESKATIVETNSDPHTALDSLRDDLVRSRTLVTRAAARRDLVPMAAGTAPLARVEDATTTPGTRYAEIDRAFARLADEMFVCGLHVHVGVEDRDVAAAACAWISPWVPTLLALSAGSPYWLGTDTGFASWRTILWRRLPTAGPMPPCRSASDYDAMVSSLIDSGVISDRGMVYQDMRLSAHVPTLELRVCDSIADIDGVLLAAALFRALVRHGTNAVLAGHEPPSTPEPLLRGATWRAARSGLEGDLIDPGTLQRARARAVVQRLVAHVADELRWYEDWDRVTHTVAGVLRTGSWARKQRAVGRRRGLPAVVDLLTDKTTAFGPSYPTPEHATDAA